MAVCHLIRHSITAVSTLYLHSSTTTVSTYSTIISTPSSVPPATTVHLPPLPVEDMEFESTHSNTTAKLPTLTLGSMRSGLIRIISNTASYKLCLWEVIENGKLIGSVHNSNKRMVLCYKRFQYISMLKKKDPQHPEDCRMLAILGFTYHHNEDLKRSSSLSCTCVYDRWNTHVVVWMNKAEIETMSIDDLYHNFKTVEQSVKKSVGASSGAQNLAFMTAPSTSSTNDVNTAKHAYEVSTVSPNVNTANDLEAADLKWQLSLLSMRAKRQSLQGGQGTLWVALSTKSMVYVDDIIFGSTNKELCIAFEKLMKDNQDKYVVEILKKFNYTDVKCAFTPVDLEKPLVKDGDVDDVDAHLYRSMIGSLMYLTASRPDIMFAVCACARFQVTPKTSHLLAVKSIFRYLKGKPTLRLWYSRDYPFELVAYTDSDYAGATQDRKSTTGGSEYVAAASCCGQVLWIQNQLLDYGYNFMNTMIHIDNNSTICIIENPVQHSKTKHIEIRHHFIRDCNAKKLIQMVKIDTEHNVADLLTKGFDVGRHVKRGRDTKIPQFSGPPVKVGDEAVHKELGDRIERAATTTSSLEAEQNSGAQTRFETTSKQSNNPPLSRVNTLGSGEDSMKLNEKSEGSEGFHQIIDFLTASHIKNALTECPTLYASPIEQFWQTAALSTNEDGVRGITVTIDRKVKVFVSEASIRRHIKLEDSEGLKTLPIAEIFEQLALKGYVITSNSLTFQKGHFSPQWKFFIHTILHCLSPKKTAWE
ncbi:hypothetical protein Tco_0294123 [Tanacetum coccineum]